VDENSLLIEALNKKYDLNSRFINERIPTLKKLKEEISIFSLKFSEFEAEKQPKHRLVPVFAKGAAFYTGLTLQIIQELDADIKRTEKELELQQEIKDSKITAILEMLDCQYSDFKHAVIPKQIQ
jgi:hypothetical protein